MRSRFAPSSSRVNTAAVARTRRMPVIETLEGRRLMSAAISGNVYNDVNVNGVFKAGDPELAGVRVYVDTANTGSYTAADPNALTDSKGNYTISGLTTGSKIVREVVPGGFRQSLPSNGAGQMLTLPNSSSHAQNVNFGDTQKGRFSGIVFKDANKDSLRQTSESGLSGVNVFLDINMNGVLDTGDVSIKTNAGGSFVFDNLSPAKDYFIEVELTGSKAGAYAGWIQTDPFYTEALGGTLDDGQAINTVVFGIHAPSKIVYNSENRTVLAIAGSNSQSFTSTSTGDFFKQAHVTDPSKFAEAYSNVSSIISTGGFEASGSLSGSASNNADSAFGAVDVTFTVPAATVYYAHYNIDGDAFYYSLKDATTGKYVIGPNKADPKHPQTSYALSNGGTLAAGTYQLLFNVNNSSAQALKTFDYHMFLSL